MRNVRTLALIGGTIALAATAVPATPLVGSAAERGTIAVVQGMPGRKVDVCINGREVKSRLRYGGRSIREMRAGTKRLKVFRPDRRRCKGRVLMKKRFDLDAGGDLSLVLTKRSPKVLVFDNEGLGSLGPATHAGVTDLRHAADLGTVRFHRESGSGDILDPAGVCFDTTCTFDKGESDGFTYAAEDAYRLWATFPDSARVIAGVFTLLREDRRHELYLVGTKRRNARWVELIRAIDPDA